MVYTHSHAHVTLLQAEVDTGRSVYQIPCRAAMNSVEWNPKYNLLAFAADDKNKYQTDEGMPFLRNLPVAMLSYFCKHFICANSSWNSIVPVLDCS